MNPQDNTMPQEHPAGGPTLYSVALSIERLDAKLDGYQTLVAERLDRTNRDVQVVKDEIGGIAQRVQSLESTETERAGAKRALVGLASVVGAVVGALGSQLPALAKVLS